MLTRRFFLRGSAMAMAGVGSAPLWLSRAVAAEGTRRKVLVAIFQRGAADGLNIVAPFFEKRYYELRPSIAVQPPSSSQSPNGQNGSIDLDGRFALHPSLQPLKALWEKQQLAIIQATGSPDPSRSHFDAQDYMESGTPGKTSGDGWLNRALPPAGPGASPLRAIAMGSQLPRTLRGDRAAIAVNDVQSFQMGNDTASILENMYATTADARLESTGKDAFAAMKMIRSLNGLPFNNATAPQYAQGGELGRGLQQVARLIKADVGVEAAFAEVGGWDHHGQEPGQLGNLLRQFGMALSAFYQDMGDRMEDVVLVTMSEFGRTAQENGDNGTDHGHGSVMMVLGGPVRGGKVYGPWPGLQAEQLYEGRDLAVTTDFREVLGELVTGHLGQKNLAAVFPGYQPAKPLGLLRS
ncbi:MAG TPA: DUF1501 domain-containing protein [Bryobacteraceae bacterium]|jgi:uncharacterized protein (DUF1501 family)|nr:DUF1501 domain-containing protein [Bryobacteraceae bacterium]